MKWNVCERNKCAEKRRNSGTRRQTERINANKILLIRLYITRGCQTWSEKCNAHFAFDQSCDMFELAAYACNKERSKGVWGRVNMSERVCKQVSVALFTTVYVYFSFSLFQRPHMSWCVCFFLSRWFCFIQYCTCVYFRTLALTTSFQFSSVQKGRVERERSKTVHIRMMKFIISEMLYELVALPQNMSRQ